MKLFVFAFIFALAAPTFAQQQDHHDHPRPDGHLAWTRDNTHAHVFWEVGPTLSEESVMRLEFMNGNLHKPTNIDAEVSVELWMSLHNHGSAPVKIERIANAEGTFDTAVYRVSKISFVMEGDWEVRVKLVYPDGNSEIQALPVRVGESRPQFNQ